MTDFKVQRGRNRNNLNTCRVKHVIDLLGPGADIWPGVVRDRTRELIARQTAPAGQGRKPFAEGLKLPRDATQKVLARLRAGVRFVLVDGPPLVGKSNVLRELAETTQTSAQRHEAAATANPKTAEPAESSRWTGAR